jgi:putative cardiolipin synthase
MLDSQPPTVIIGNSSKTLRCAAALLLGAVFGGCASLPPGSDYPKVASTALVNPGKTTLGQHFEILAGKNGGNSGFRMISVGADGFLTRMQMINAAERTLDLQYYIFRGDDTGRLLTNAALRAADRGVRVRVLVDDGDTVSGDEQIASLAAHRSVEIRIFNPFAYRGHVKAVKTVEFMFNSRRLNYRMHNKLLVVDNSVALIGGRNIGDEYFQLDPDSQFADDDMFVAGPIVTQLSASFDEFWNNALSIPGEALSTHKSSHAALTEQRQLLSDEPPQVKTGGIDYVKQVAAGEPFGGMLSGRLALIWSHVQLVSDSPDKKSAENASTVGRLMHRPVAVAMNAAQSELLLVTPYLIPGEEGMQLFEGLRRRNVRIRILTNSLESSTVLTAQSGYMPYRMPLLESGVELYEVRSLLGNSKGSGQSAAITRFGNYSLHAKMFVIDRQRLFVGSMNFDQRSMHLNTEIGLLIDSPTLAQQVATRFEAMVQPANSYQLALITGKSESRRHLVWRTQEGGRPIQYETEPARSHWQATKAAFFSKMPMDSEL